MPVRCHATAVTLVCAMTPQCQAIIDQHIRGRGSPTSISIILVPPNWVCISTMRAGSSRISPMIAASSPPSISRSAARAASAACGRDHGQQFALVGDIDRIDAQDLAGALHDLANGHLLFPDRHAIAGVTRQLVQHGADSAARGVAHEAQVGSRGALERGYQRRQGPRVRADLRLQVEVAARDQDGHAVIAQRAGAEDFVARVARRSRRE